MKHIKKVLSYSIVGSLGLTVVAGLQGCGQPSQPPQGVGVSQSELQNQNFFLVIEQTGTDPATYKLAEKHPTEGATRAILRTPDGKERILSNEELKQIADKEAEKVEAGTSRLTQESGMQSGGLSLGETILAAAAGSLIGGMLANKLMGNNNFQRNQQRVGGGRPATTQSRPKTSSSANKTSSSSKPRSGFFGGNRSGSSSSSRSFGG